MKNLKILISFSALLFALSFQPAHSQSQLLNIKPSKATLTNTDTAYLVINDVQYTDVLSFHYVQKKVTGTVAGKAYLQGSNDNATWFNATTDTLALANGDNIKGWVLTPSTWRYYRIQAITSNGTSTPSCRVYLSNKIRRWKTLNCAYTQIHQ